MSDTIWAAIIIASATLLKTYMQGKNDFKIAKMRIEREQKESNESPFEKSPALEMPKNLLQFLWKYEKLGVASVIALAAFIIYDISIMILLTTQSILSLVLLISIAFYIITGIERRYTAYLIDDAISRIYDRFSQIAGIFRTLVSKLKDDS